MGDVTLELYKVQERRLAAEEARRGLVVHGAVTAAVIVALVLVNVFVASELPWAIFPAVGMSIGLFAHWLFGVKRGDEAVQAHQAEVEQAARTLAA